MIFERVAFRISSSKLRETQAFYADRFGFELAEQGEDRFTIRAGATLLTFKAAAAGERPLYHFALNVPENKFAEVKTWAASKVALIEEEGDDEVFFTSWNAHSVYFEDPAGNIVEFIARHNLASGIDHAFTASDVMSISEVGIVAEETLPLVRELNAAGLSNWREASEEFTPVGDEQGLLIVVRNEREWYFSNGKQARFYPVEVTVAGVGRFRFSSINRVETGSSV
ncbi:ring-cleaving dioxygenase [Paenibacillus oralis]|uniref:Ring-cleaving dioxygenase n=1 Tax=Paenibacillus oralis TaxID=2490856 RepID=A0A3P3U718_9BACL|nr:ring-cleaving dioxygenase [Paenibacillus oralis]RRJ66162.1 ring-cleaving dioxygenase [Paenibacillus oralis]